jgi:hypothetical protein
MAEGQETLASAEASAPPSAWPKRWLIVLAAALALTLVKASVNRDDPRLAYPSWQQTARRLSYQEIVALYRDHAAKNAEVAKLGIDAWARQMQAKYGNVYDFSALLQNGAGADAGQNASPR